MGHKDAIFEGSDPLRHSIELLAVLRCHLDQLPPYLILFLDRGGDHNVTFLFPQWGMFALFKAGDFDVLNVGCCAPNQSFFFFFFYLGFLSRTFTIHGTAGEGDT